MRWLGLVLLGALGMAGLFGNMSWFLFAYYLTGVTPYVSPMLLMLFIIFGVFVLIGIPAGILVGLLGRGKH